MIIDTLIKIEKERLSKLGFSAVVSAEDITIFDTEYCVALGNDTIILTGFLFDDDTKCGEDERVTIVSPSDEISGNASMLSSFHDAGRYKVLRDYMIVKRLNSTTISDSAESMYEIDMPNGTQSPLTISFIRISPKKNNK